MIGWLALAQSQQSHPNHGLHGWHGWHGGKVARSERWQGLAVGLWSGGGLAKKRHRCDLKLETFLKTGKRQKTRHRVRVAGSLGLWVVHQKTKLS